MTTSDNREIYDYGVFLVHSEEDIGIAKHIYAELSSKFKCVAQFDEKAFVPGKPVFHRITELIEKSWRTLLLLTENSKKSTWVNLETILALEHSQYRADKEVPLRVVFVGIKKEEISILKGGYHTDEEDLLVDFNHKDWITRLKKGIESK